MAQIKNKFLADNAVDENKFRLSNDGSLKARNAANSADVDLFKLDTSDILQFLSHPRISSSAVNTDDVLTKKDLDASLDGLKPKEAVRLATDANITLSGNQSIDGVLSVTGDRILVWQQTDATENGIYVAAAGAWARAADFDSLTPEDEINGAYTMAQEGSTYAGWSFVQFGTVSTIGSDDIDFTVRSNLSFSGGDGIDVTGTTISVDHDGEGLTFSVGQLSLELDGGTLTKSATGLKVADNGIDEGQLSSNIDAESFQIAAGYTPAAGTVAATDTLQVAFEKLDGNIQAIDTATAAQESFTLDGTDISNQYVDLTNIANAGSVILTPDGGPMQIEGVDYILSTPGAFTRVTFAGDLASGGDAALVATDVIYIKYTH